MHSSARPDPYPTPHPRSTRRRAILLAAIALLPVSLGSQAAHAAAPRAGAADQAVPPVCAWRTVLGASKRNASYVEGNSTAWTSYYYAHQGLLLHVTGQFPHARYMSFSVQPIEFNDAGALTFLAGGTNLYDARISPDKGNANPFASGANRTASKRRYSIWIRYQKSTASGHGNYLPAAAGASSLGALVYHVYAPDQGQNAQGGVPLPAIDKVAATGQGGKPVVVHVPLCGHIDAPRADFLAQPVADAVKNAPAFSWRRPLNASPQSQSDAHLDYSSLVTRVRHDAGLAVVRFKAPTFANTYNGGSISGREQVRYWSMCEYEMSSQRLMGCLADYQSRPDKNGIVTLVLGDPSQKPLGSTLKGASWLPFGFERQGILIYRQVLPSPSFAQALQRAPSSSTALRSRLGAYYPAIVDCSASQWAKNGCSAS